MISRVVRHTVSQHADALAAYLPGGRLFAGKYRAGSDLRKVIEGLAVELANAENFIALLQDEFLPDTTVLFLDEWESALGIPDGCFSGTGTQEERRQAILVKLAALGVQTVADFENLAAIFGVTATVLPGEEATPVPPDPKFTIVIEFVSPDGFPYTFPFIFGSETIAILECLFNKLKPANCVVEFRETT